VRVHGWLIGLLLLASLAGLFLAARRERWAIALLALYAFVMMAVPAVTGEYTARYAVPAAGPLAAAGALGGWALWARFRRGGRAPAPPASPAGA
jgi:4-amino-4-deoxy-L-arabinose transferase-like glycosyltransferase